MEFTLASADMGNSISDDDIRSHLQIPVYYLCIDSLCRSGRMKSRYAREQIEEVMVMTEIIFNTQEHRFHQDNCGSCLPGYPCKCSCGGHIHAEVSKNNFPGMTLVYKCDACDFVLDLVED